MSGPPQPASGADPSMEDILASIRRILSEDESAESQAHGGPAATAETSTTAGDAGDVLALDASMMVDAGDAPGHGASSRQAAVPPPSPPAPSLPALPAPPLAAEPHTAHPPPAGIGRAPEPAVDGMDFDPPPRAPTWDEPPQPVPYHGEPARFPPDEGLVAPEAAAAAASSMGSLIRQLAAERATPVYRGGPTLEDLVRDEMRPMLKEWLDAHLPAMVERLVRAEIERVVNGSLR